MTESMLEVKIAVIEEKLSSISEDMKEARHARKAQYEQNERQSQILLKMDHRLETVEAFMISTKPTIEEYLTLRNKAQGAGIAGKFLWALAAGSIGLAAGATAVWSKWFGG